MNQEFKTELIETLIERFGPGYCMKVSRLSNVGYYKIYRVLKRGQKDKRQTVLNACLKAIGIDKANENNSNKLLKAIK